MPRARRLLVDSDAFFVLAGSDLLEVAAQLFGVTLAEVHRLDPLPHMLRKRRERGDIRSRRAFDLAIGFCDRTSAIQEQVRNADLLSRLVAIDRIDPGEALLFAVAVEDPDALMVTGDKKALKALSRGIELQDVRDTLAGRIVCLETVFLGLLRALGPETLRERCAEVQQNHRTLELVLGPEGGDLARLTEGFESYERNLRAETGETLLFRF